MLVNDGRSRALIVIFIIVLIFIIIVSKKKEKYYKHKLEIEEENYNDEQDQYEKYDNNIIHKQIILTHDKGTIERKLKGMDDRYYVIHIPENLPNMPVPLLLCFHGMTRTAWYTAHNETKWIKWANKKTFYSSIWSINR